jgi:hypothetical protein
MSSLHIYEMTDVESRPLSTSSTVATATEVHSQPLTNPQSNILQSPKPQSHPQKPADLDQEIQKFTSTFLAQTIRVKSPQSALVSWPPITPPQTQMRGTFHYICEEIASLIPLDTPTRKAIQELINNYNPTHFDDHVPRKITAFIENLVLEANGLLDISLKKESINRNWFGFWDKLLRRSSKEEREEMRMLAAFKAKRVSVAEILGVIWEFRAPIWDTPRYDSLGQRYWASNVEGVRGSKAWAVLARELGWLRREVLDFEEVRFEMSDQMANWRLVGPAE